MINSSNDVMVNPIDDESLDFTDILNSRYQNDDSLVVSNTFLPSIMQTNVDTRINSNGIYSDSISDLIEDKVDMIVKGKIKFNEEVYVEMADRLSRDPHLLRRITGGGEMPKFWETPEGEEVKREIDQMNFRLNHMETVLSECLFLLEKARDSYLLPE